jgi:crotonobetainyl-CoA:carnitine CoA-transferase CaiB-like acyl-CoA transferase
MGAEIIKIEPPKGDWMRAFALGNVYKEGESASFLSFNRNKRSISIDIKRPGALDVVRRLVANSDVVVENFRPGVMDRLGIGYEALKEVNPRIIYCASSGFGPTGPYVTRPGQDLLIQSMTGFPAMTGRRQDPPTPSPVGIADLVASQHIVYGILAALYSREKTGKGQRVDVSLYNSLLALMIQELTTYLNGGGWLDRSRTGIPCPYLGAPYGLYRTADNWIAIAMNPVNQLARLIGVSGYEHIDSKNQMEGGDEIKEAFQVAFLTKTTAEWLDILLAEDIWCGPLYTFMDVEEDPQVRENEMIISYDHPLVGEVRTVGIPVKFHGTPSEVTRPAPLLGQHTDEILKDVGGFTDEEIKQLRDQRVVL